MAAPVTVRGRDEGGVQLWAGVRRVGSADRRRRCRRRGRPDRGGRSGPRRRRGGRLRRPHDPARALRLPRPRHGHRHQCGPLPADAVLAEVLRGDGEPASDDRHRRHHRAGRRWSRPRAEDRRRAGPRARAAPADLDQHAEPDGRPRRRLAGLRCRGAVVLRAPSRRARLGRGRTGRDASAGARARPRRRRRDQGRDQRRGPVTPRRSAPRALPRRRAGRADGGGEGGRQVGDGPRPGHRRHQGRGPPRDPLDRARDLPRRPGDRDDADPRHLPGADAGGSSRGARSRAIAACRSRRS